jgi:phage terminase large subunit
LNPQNLIRIKLPTNKIYRPLYDAQQRYQIVFGGSSSGKSVWASQRVIRDLIRGGRNYLCTREVQNTIRKSLFNELRQTIDRAEANEFFKINKSELTVTAFNGYQAICSGLDDPEKIKSIRPQRGVITDIWIEEATETAADSLKQLDKRLRGYPDEFDLSKVMRKRILMTFNPIMRSHWIYERFFKPIAWADDQTQYIGDDLLILKTTYCDNACLTTDDCRALENETDEYFYNVYTLGQWGILGDVIFKNWKTHDILNDPIYQTFDYYRNGLDFGFSNDPTAFNRMYYHSASKTLYITHEYNEKEVTNPEIAEAIKPFLNGDHVVCDSAEPKSIKELNLKGVRAIGAKKGKDSILHGIQWLKQQKIIIDKRCINTINNFQQYHWKKDKDGNAVNVPVDKNDDHIDNIRYACEDIMLRDHETKISGIPSKAVMR